MADSWFTSVKTALELEKRDLFYIGIVKTATKQFPIKILKEKCPNQRGAAIVSQTTINDVNVISCGWRDKKIHTFVGACSTTLQGTPAKKIRTNENVEKKYILEVPRIKIIKEYFQGAPSIDVHNLLRQSGLALEEVWHTQNWKHRLYASLLGIIETNTYLAFQYFKKEVKLSHADFTKNLAYQLLTHE